MKRSGLAVVTAVMVAWVVGLGIGSAQDPIGPPDGGDFDPLAEVAGELDQPVTIGAAIEPGGGGKPDVLTVTATLEEGWHLYSVTQKPGGPLATRITVAADSPRQAAGPFVPGEPPHVRTVDEVPAWKGLPIEEHAGTVVWRAPLAPGGGDVRGAVRLQLCQDTACLPPRTIAFEATAGATGRGVAAEKVPAAAQSDAAPAATYTPERSHVRLEASFGRSRDEAGRKVWPLRVQLVPEAGWHLYKPAATAETEIGQGKPTLVRVDGPKERVLSLRATEAEAAVAAELAAAGAVDGPVQIEILVADDPEAEEPVGLVLGFQTCSDTTCDPPTGVRLAVDPPAPDGEALIDFEPAKYGEAAAAPAPLALAALAAPAVSPPAPEVTGSTPPALSQAASISLPLALLMGLAGGLILNLMPCVLPVLGLKLMSFAQQSGRARQEVFQMNLW
ncbi:MAG: hypothetical protein ACKO1M_06475 [Planctomycetota bacterium]